MTHPLTLTQTKHKILEVLAYFSETLDKIDKDDMHTNRILRVSIENVAHRDIMALYLFMQFKQPDVVRLYMPWDIDGDNIVIVFIPATSCVIHIESEQVERVKPSLNNVNLN